MTKEYNIIAHLTDKKYYLNIIKIDTESCLKIFNSIKYNLIFASFKARILYFESGITDTKIFLETDREIYFNNIKKIFNINTPFYLTVKNSKVKNFKKFKILKFNAPKIYDENFLEIKNSISPSKININYTGGYEICEHPLRFLIVLGTGNPIVLSKRLERCFEIFNSSDHEVFNDFESGTLQNTYIIFSGYSGTFINDFQISESKIMKKYAIKRGIPSKYIIEENKSINTFQNLSFSLKIIEDNWSSLNFKKEIFVISSSSHIPRCKIICEKFFPLYNLNFISTNEKISISSQSREEKLIKLILDKT